MIHSLFIRSLELDHSAVNPLNATKFTYLKVQAGKGWDTPAHLLLGKGLDAPKMNSYSAQDNFEV